MMGTLHTGWLLESTIERDHHPVNVTRQNQLLDWIRADEVARDWTYKSALQNWRDDVITRIKPTVPCRLKLPESLARVCGLATQLVCLNADHSVQVITMMHGRRRYTKGRELIPAR